MEVRCYRKILPISHNGHATNEEVHAKIQQVIGPHEDLLTIVKRRKLKWYGHVSSSSGLAKSNLQGTMKGEEDKADRRRCEKTTSREWTVPGSAKFQRAVEKFRTAVENKEKWRKLIVKSSVVPQRPSRVKE